MEKAAKLNQLAKQYEINLYNKAADNTSLFLQQELMPYMRKLAEQGQYFCRLHYLRGKFNLPLISHFESMSKPKEGMNLEQIISTLTYYDYTVEKLLSQELLISWANNEDDENV